MLVAASTPYQASCRMPGTPASSKVGTPGASGLRAAPVTASARTLPCRISGSAACSVLTSSAT
ncbi:hypothetical protein D3C81_1798950 [compost metagenome]